MIPNPEISRISLTALRFRDSPEDVLPRPSTPPRETAVSFGDLPFPPLRFPSHSPGDTDVGRTSIMQCSIMALTKVSAYYSIKTVLVKT